MRNQSSLDITSLLGLLGAESLTPLEKEKLGLLKKNPDITSFKDAHEICSQLSFVSNESEEYLSACMSMLTFCDPASFSQCFIAFKLVPRDSQCESDAFDLLLAATTSQAEFSEAFSRLIEGSQWEERLIAKWNISIIKRLETATLTSIEDIFSDSPSNSHSEKAALSKWRTLLQEATDAALTHDSMKTIYSHASEDPHEDIFIIEKWAWVVTLQEVPEMIDILKKTDPQAYLFALPILAERFCAKEN